jgi:hypothetical protein
VSKAKFHIAVVFTIADFAAALDEPDAWVIYEGHSRYGQGAAFGPADAGICPDPKRFVDNPWSNYFRMGYDATDTDGKFDILQFATNPTEFDPLAPIAAKAFLPESIVDAAKKAQALDKQLKKSKASPKKICATAGAWREFASCEPTLATTVTCRNTTPLKDRHFYKILKHTKTYIEYVTPVLAGSVDLDKTSLKCSVLFMSSCSSYPHYFAPLDRRRTAAKSKCKFYLTDEICKGDGAMRFIDLVFKGNDPLSKKGGVAIARALNAFDMSGRVKVH